MGLVCDKIKFLSIECAKVEALGSVAVLRRFCTSEALTSLAEGILLCGVAHAVLDTASSVSVVLDVVHPEADTLQSGMPSTYKFV